MSRRPPRYAYWLAGAAIACAGAFGARFLAQYFPASYRVPIWLTGCAIIFVGLSVVSLGTRHRLNPDDADDAGSDQPADTKTPPGRRQRPSHNGNGERDGGNDGP